VRRLFLVLIGLLSFAAAQAATLADYTFDDPATSEDFRDIIEEMRCLVCQNESLAGSNAELAVDLRNEIYDMMKAGQGKQEVVDFMVARYGDFVLYSPPMKLSTLPLWFGPLILFVIGWVLLMRTLRRKRQSQETTLSAEEEQRLQALINQSPASQDSKK
jgi:cytochrome c-type biogenesis protein CcmH